MNINLIVKAMTSGKYVVNGKYQWKAMVADIEAKDPHCFDGIDNPAEKIRKMVSTKQVQALIAAAEAKKLKKAVKKAAKKVSAKAEATQPELVEETVRKNGDVRRVVALDTKNDLSNMSSDEIIARLGYDPKEMELVSSSVKMSNWDAQTSSDSTKTMKSYRISGTVRPRKDMNVQNMMEIIDYLDNHESSRPARKRTNIDGNRCAVINMADVHYGCLAEADQCGREYNIEIAEANVYHVIEEAIETIKSVGGVKQIFFHWCQDFFHCDNKRGTTTKGTPLDMSCSAYTMLIKGTEILKNCISMLEEVAPVDTFYTESNHSEGFGLLAAHLLKSEFKHDENVTVDVLRLRRKYRQFGNHMFGFGHGDKEGRRIFFNPSIDEPEMWGKTTHREMFLGHIHHAKMEDVAGVIFRYDPSLAVPDDYSVSYGFTGYKSGSERGSMLHIRDEIDGLQRDYLLPPLY